MSLEQFYCLKELYSVPILTLKQSHWLKHPINLEYRNFSKMKKKNKFYQKIATTRNTKKLITIPLTL